MPPRSPVERALELFVQAGLYASLGPSTEELAAATRRDLGEVVDSWPERSRQALAATAGRVTTVQRELDRGRNHFIKAFRARHGAENAAWPAELRNEFDRGLAEFTRKKDETFQDAVDFLHSTLDAEVRA